METKRIVYAFRFGFILFLTSPKVCENLWVIYCIGGITFRKKGKDNSSKVSEREEKGWREESRVGWGRAVVPTEWVCMQVPCGLMLILTAWRRWIWRLRAGEGWGRIPFCWKQSAVVGSCENFPWDCSLLFHELLTPVISSSGPSDQRLLEFPAL